MNIGWVGYTVYFETDLLPRALQRGDVVIHESVDE